MESFTAHDITHKNGGTTHYYEGGSKDGIPLIFIHGWPDIAEIWKHQLAHFSVGSKYRVIAPDMRGYGDSSAPTDKRAYRLEVLVEELVEVAEELGIKKAIWVAHDWGCGLVSALAAHHPELCLGIAVIAVPYRTIELGLNYILPLVNRDIYPEEEYPYGQWSYMKYYEKHGEEGAKVMDAHVEKVSKIFYVKHDPTQHGKPSAGTSTVLKDGGFFGGNPEALPDLPLEYTSLDQSLHDNLLKSHKKHGFFPPTAWYLNHDVNEQYAKSEKNGGVLESPVLFIDAKHDAVCSPSTTPKLGEPQKEHTKDLTYETIESGHWVQIEKPKETNVALEKWLNAKF